MHDHGRLDRSRQSAFDDQLDLLDREVSGSSGIAVRTFALSSYPTAAGSYFACRPLAVSGNDVEGSMATLTPDNNQVVFVANLGSAVPPTGTNLIAYPVDSGRYATRYDG